MGTLRGAAILSSFMALTVPLMPVQAVLVRTSQRAARKFPHWYHRKVCNIIGVRLHIEGAVARDRPVLLIANHTSWLDIPVLSAVAPVSFVAKKEVGSWPFVSSLARLQRTVFVDRTRRVAVGDTAGEISQRLQQGDAIVLFAEGTSSDGNRVLPFLSSLFAAAKPPGPSAPLASEPVVQTVSVVYTHRHGVPLGRADRPDICWYGDMEMQSHAWALLKGGPLDATIVVGPPVPLDQFRDRKDLAEKTEIAVRQGVVRTLRARNEDVVVTRPSQPAKRPVRRAESEGWR
jgi:lyso-ornithine lipid O-acyltransferase